MITMEQVWHAVLLAAAVVLLAVNARTGSVTAQPPGGEGPQGDAAPRLAQFKAAGRQATLTVLPTGLVGRPVRQVGDVIAMMLERAGMTNLEVDAPEFTPPEKADLNQTAAALAAFLKANPIHTDYALYADFLGSPAKGFEEVRIVVTNAEGECVWQDRQTTQDTAFRRMNPREPMQCCLLVVERLKSVLGLDDPTRDSAPEGKLARRWAEQTGLPDKAEQEAMQQRQVTWKQSGAATKWLVYPGLAGEEVSVDSAKHLVQLIGQSHRAQVSLAAEGPQLKITSSMNEQQVLWQMARGVRDYVRTHRPDAEYVLFAHYIMGRDAGGNVRVGGVHFTICDRSGDWVVVDFQNSHHRDFGAIQPRSRDDCDQLVMRRLESLLR